MKTLLAERRCWLRQRKLYSLLLLSFCVWDYNQSVDGHVDQKRPHSGIEDRTRQQLVCQVDWKQVGLTSTCQPATKIYKNKTQTQTQTFNSREWQWHTEEWDYILGVGLYLGSGLYLILRVTPCGTPMLMVADRTLCRLIFLSAPYSNTVPNQPVL